MRANAENLFGLDCSYINCATYLSGGFSQEASQHTQDDATDGTEALFSQSQTQSVGPGIASNEMFFDIQDHGSQQYQQEMNTATFDRENDFNQPVDNKDFRYDIWDNKDYSEAGSVGLKQQFENPEGKWSPYPSHKDMLELICRLKMLLQDILIREDGTLSEKWIPSANAFHSLCEKLFVVSSARVMAAKIMPTVLEELCCSSAVIEFIKELNAKDCEYLMQQYGIMALKLLARVKGFATELIKLQQGEQLKRLQSHNTRFPGCTPGCTNHGWECPRGACQVQKESSYPCVTMNQHGVPCVTGSYAGNVGGFSSVSHCQNSFMQVSGGGSVPFSGCHGNVHYPRQHEKIDCGCMGGGPFRAANAWAQAHRFAPGSGVIPANHCMVCPGCMGTQVPSCGFSCNQVHETSDSISSNFKRDLNQNNEKYDASTESGYDNLP